MQKAKLVAEAARRKTGSQKTKGNKSGRRKPIILPALLYRSGPVGVVEQTGSPGRVRCAGEDDEGCSLFWAPEGQGEFKPVRSFGHPVKRDTPTFPVPSQDPVPWI